MSDREKRPAADSSPPEVSPRARILVVDDQDDVRELLVTALEFEGHEVDEGTASSSCSMSASSAASLQARRNLDQQLERFDRRQIKYSVCDLGRDPGAGESDRVAFTPTLVKRYPAPRTWVLGTLRETEIVADLLRVSGVEAKA